MRFIPLALAVASIVGYAYTSAMLTRQLSMEAKASAAIIGALPPVVMILVYITSPAYISLLFTEQLGNVILGASAVWMTIGILVMRKMINFDF